MSLMPDTATALSDTIAKLRAERISDRKKLTELGFSAQLPQNIPAELRPALTKLQQEKALFYRCSLSGTELSLVIALVPEVENGELELFVVDEGINELYTGHLHGSGSFNAELRERMAAIVQEIFDQASRAACFALPQQQRLIAYARQKFNAEPEFLWADSPSSAILRNLATRKWFAVLLEPKAKVVGLDGPGTVPLINLHLDKELVQELIKEGSPYLPAYHMNKTYWLSVRLGHIEDEKLFELLHLSFLKA